MIYKILIKDKNDGYKFATEQKDILELKQLSDGSRDYIKTGKKEIVIFETEDIDVLKQKFESLMQNYSYTSLKAIVDMTKNISVSLNIADKTE